MEFFKKKTRIDFMSKRHTALILSTTVNVICLALLIFRGLNLGLDFTGGMFLQINYDQPVELAEVRGALSKTSYGGAVVQYFGTRQQVMIRLESKEGQSTEKVGNQVLDALRAESDSHVNLRRLEFIGPEVGEDLMVSGWLAMIYAMIGILIYVAFRFEYRFAIGAIVGLIHDVLITLGLFSIFWLEFDLTVLAAVLTIIGYSLNDSIVVSDRIRENFRKLRKTPTVDVMNVSINETLSRTVMTGTTTLLVLFIFYLLGGEAVHGFSIALIIGILVGTYSSVYIASPIALALGVSKSDYTLPKEDKTGEGLV